MGIEFLTITTNGSAQVRHERYNGREYLVAPMTLIVPGVLNGSQGPLLYTEEDVHRDPNAWNGMPLVVYHPTRNGRNVSAHDPEWGQDIIQKSGVGFVRNAFAKGKLGAEGWFDKEHTRTKRPDVYQRLIRNERVELSTGLFTTNVPKIGNWNGVPYTHVATNWRPDHVAVLPDQVGACSLRDGCGILVNQRTKQRVLTSNCGGKGSRKPGPCKGKKTIQAGDRMRFDGTAVDGSVSGSMEVTVIDPHSNKDQITSVDKRGREYAGVGQHIRQVVVERPAHKFMGDIRPAKRFTVHEFSLHHLTQNKSCCSGCSGGKPCCGKSQPKAIRMRTITPLTNCGGKGGKPGPCRFVHTKSKVKQTAGRLGTKVPDKHYVKDTVTGEEHSVDGPRQAKRIIKQLLDQVAQGVQTPKPNWMKDFADSLKPKPTTNCQATKKPGPCKKTTSTPPVQKTAPTQPQPTAPTKPQGRLSHHTVDLPADRSKLTNKHVVDSMKQMGYKFTHITTKTGQAYKVTRPDGKSGRVSPEKLKDFLYSKQRKNLPTAKRIVPIAKVATPTKARVVQPSAKSIKMKAQEKVQGLKQRVMGHVDRLKQGVAGRIVKYLG